MKSRNDSSDLVEDVAGRAATGRSRGKNLAAVLTLSEEINEVLALGYSWKVIWQALSAAGRIERSYDTFRYTCRFCGLSTLKDRSPLAPSLHRTWLNGSSPVASMVAGDESRNGEVSNIGY